MKKTIIIISIFLISFLAVSVISVRAEAAVYFVAKDGNDANNGSETSPWLTIQKAADSLQAGDTVYVKEGTYNEDVIITTSGEKAKRIVFSAGKNQKVTVAAKQYHAFYILGDYITISDFNIKGAPKEIYDPNDPNAPDWTRSGITTHRSYNIFRNNEISDCMYGIMIRARGGEDGDGELSFPSDGYNVVKDNYIHHTDRDGIRVKRSNYNTISYNRFSRNSLELHCLRDQNGNIIFYTEGSLVFYALKNLTIINNIFYEPGFGPVILEIDMTTRTTKPPSMAPNPEETCTYPRMDNIEIKNNIAYKTENTDYPIMLTLGRDFAVGKNNCMDNNVWYNGKPGSKMIEWGFNFWHDNDQDDLVMPQIWTLQEFRQNTGKDIHSRDTSLFD